MLNSGEDGLTIVYLPISSLKASETNARAHGDADVEAIAASIREFGFNDPVGIWSNENIVVEGHGRILAAQSIGMQELPCVRLDHLSDAGRRAYALAHNRTAELSKWDEAIRDAEIEAIRAIEEIDMTQFGFEIQESIGGGMSTSATQENDYQPEIPEEPVTKSGDVWQLGRHRLLCGDSTDKAQIEKLMNGNKADMVLTDPPYGMRLDTDFSGIHGLMKSIGRKNKTQGNKYPAVIGDGEDFKPELIRTIFENFQCEEMFLFGADYYAELVPNRNIGSWLVWDKRKETQADAIGSEFELIWSKNRHKRRVLRHDWFGFLSSENQSDARHRVHPTQKPVSLLVDIIEQWGKSATRITDIYGGSGSTLIACEKTGKTCYMMEIDPRYCDVIKDRFEKFTGEKAVLLHD